MRFLLDNNLSPRLGTLLAEAGHDVVHVRDVGLAQAPDDAVLARAEGEDRILNSLIDVEADLDVGSIVVLGETTIRIRRLPLAPE